MRDIDATIEQAIALGSHKRIKASELDAIDRKSIKGFGKFDSFKLLIDAYDFGFTLGYRMGRKKEASAEAPAK